MKRTKVKMNKPIHLGLSILEISKLLMYEFWYDYMKPKYGDNVKLCYMDTDSFIMNIKTEDFYKDILINFNDFKCPLHIFKSIYNGYKTLEDIEHEQEKFREEIGYIKQGNPKRRPEEQQKTIDNVEKLYNVRQEIVKMFNDYAKNMSKNIYESKQQKGTGLKILTPNQMLKSLPIALAQIKAGNNSKSLLNEIRQIVYALYPSKEITKKVYNNIIKSIKV